MVTKEENILIEQMIFFHNHYTWDEYNRHSVLFELVKRLNELMSVNKYQTIAKQISVLYNNNILFPIYFTS